MSENKDAIPIEPEMKGENKDVPAIETPVQLMDKAVKCLYLELPIEIADNIFYKWNTAKEFLYSSLPVQPAGVNGYRTEATWFDNYSAFWIIDKSTGKAIAMSLGKTQEEAAENSIKIISALETPIHSGEERLFTLAEMRQCLMDGLNFANRENFKDKGFVHPYNFSQQYFSEKFGIDLHKVNKSEKK